VRAVCAGTKRNGEPCTVSVPDRVRFCYNHNPDYAEERRRNASHAANAKHSSIGKELREIRALIWELLGLTIADRLPHRARKELQNVVQLLQCYLRAAELEMRAAEEPLRSDLDMKGLRAQVLGRIEELEARKREREVLLFELVPAMEERGYDAGTVKAVMGG
jgi:hypothetical protein